MRQQFTPSPGLIQIPPVVLMPPSVVELPAEILSAPKIPYSDQAPGVVPTHLPVPSLMSTPEPRVALTAIAPTFLGRLRQHAGHFYGHIRHSLGDGLYSAINRVLPNLLPKPGPLTPEVIDLLRSMQSRPESEDDLLDLTPDDYELLAEIDNAGMLPRPMITLPTYIYSSRDFIKFLISPIQTWMDRYNLAFPGKLKKTSGENSHLKVFAKQGVEHEKKYWADLHTDKKLQEVLFGLEPGTLENLSTHLTEISEYEELRKDDYSKSCDNRFEDTLAAMRAGDDVIYQGYLRSNDGAIEGISDILVKVQNDVGVTSVFGDYHYEVWDVKLAKEPHVEHILQLCLYCDLLEQIQGVRPKRFGVINGDREVLSYKTAGYFDYYLRLKKMFFDFQSRFVANLDLLPEIPRMHDHGRYTPEIERQVRRRDSLGQVAGLLSLHIPYLRDAGIWTLRQLADSKLQKVAHIPDLTFEKYKRQARLQVESRGRLDVMALTLEERKSLSDAGIHYIKGILDVAEVGGMTAAQWADVQEQARLWIEILEIDKPKFEINPPDTNNPSSGLATLPPPSQFDIFPDFEGFKTKKISLEYLLGGVYIDYATDPKGEIKVKEFWSHTEADERKGFEALIDWWHSNWKAHPDSHIFHYGNYEESAIKHLAAKYSTRNNEVDELIENHVLVDQYKIVKQGLTIGAESYGLKTVEVFGGEKREGAVQKAVGSLEVIFDYRDNPDGETWETSEKLKSIRDYWVQDLVSTYHLRNWLYDLQQKNDIKYADPLEVRRQKQAELDEKSKERSEVVLTRRQREHKEFRERVERTKARLETWKTTRDLSPSQLHNIQHMISWADFHWRESKPVLWAMQHRHEMTQEQLVEDPACLGDMTRLATPPFQPTMPGIEFAGDDLVSAEAVDFADTDPSKILGGDLVKTSAAPFAPFKSPSRIFTYRFNPDYPPNLEVGKTYTYQTSTSDAAEDDDAQVHLGFTNADKTNADKQSDEDPSEESTQDEATAPAALDKAGDVDKVDKKPFHVEFTVESIDPSTGTIKFRFGPKILKHLDHIAPPRLTLVPRRSRSLVYTYAFDPMQDTKLESGSRCYFAHDLGISCTIVNYDKKAGEVSVRLGPKALGILDQNPPEKLGLIPNEYVSPFVIQKSIIETLEDMLDTEQNVDGKPFLPKPLPNFLKGTAATIRGHNPNDPIIPEALLSDPSRWAEFREAYYQVIKNHSGGTLTIQGPPGTGKTSLYAWAIVRLIGEERKKNGDKIDHPFLNGICCTSHAAGKTLARAIIAESKRQGVPVEIANVEDEAFDEMFEDDDPVTIARTASWIADKLKKYDFVIGTPWAFAHPGFKAQFDNVVTDEAGQYVSANFFGNARSSKKNWINMGDQSQLAPVIQGSHADGSDASVLERFAAGRRTLDPTKGITLHRTFRLKSKIANIVSDAMYDGLLYSDPATERQRVALSDDAALSLGENDREDGVIFIPVEHSGNFTKSPEEAKAVAEIYRKLLGRKYTHWDNSTRELTPDDIMVITPYVLQSKEIRSEIPEAHIGTVHKFQGQEAPVTIISLGISESNPYGRSIDHWADLHMLNTAITRARGLVIIVGSPSLENIRVRTVAQMEQLSFFYKILHAGGWKGDTTEPVYFGDEEFDPEQGLTR